jgi:3-oxoacyl-[acyl-carrier protein] reductase
MNKLLENKFAIVTGGSKGIGEAIVNKFVEEGAFVVVLDTDINLIAAGSLIGRKRYLNAYKCDVSNYSEVKAVGEIIAKRYGSIDILVNNAGITDDSTLKNMTEEQFDSVMNVNAKGTYNCTRVFSKPMIENQCGTIINASSIVTRSGNFGQTNYVASKCLIEAMTKDMASTLGTKGVRVNVVAPGFTATAMTRKIPEAIGKTIINKIPLNRFADRFEIANVYLFLASDMSSYVNGAVIRADGGLRL